MTKPSFPVEDQTDEDFFDKLVDTEVDGHEFKPRFSDNVENNDAYCYAKLSVKDVCTSSTDEIDKVDKFGVGVGEKGHHNETNSPFRLHFNVYNKKIDDPNESVVRASELSRLRSPYESSHNDIEVETTNVNGGVKEVQWSKFDTNETDEVSCSDFFNVLGESSIEPSREMAYEIGVSSNTSISHSINPLEKVVNETVAISDFLHGVSGNQDKHPNLHSLPGKEELHQALSHTISSLDQTNAYWNNIYPGWRHDPNTGQWYQVDCIDATVRAQYETTIFEPQDNDYLWQKYGSTNMNGETATYDSSNWSQTTQGTTTEYPTHMVFDPQYPGWYYDTMSQEWRSLDSYSQLENTYRGFDSDNVGSIHFSNGFMPNDQLSHFVSHERYPTEFDKSSLYEHTYQGFDSDKLKEFQGYHDDVIGNQISVRLKGNRKLDRDQQRLSSHFNGPQVVSYTPLVQNSMKPPNSSSEWWSSTASPPHALVTFGFGGRLIVMKDQSTLQIPPSYESQESPGRVISVLNIMEVAIHKYEGAHIRFVGSNYVNVLCHQSFPNPLVSNNMGMKDLNRWIDDRIVDCSTKDTGDNIILKMLLSLLRISCQYYGRLRSSFGAELKENDSPELAMAKLLTSVKRNVTQLSQCLHNMPTEEQMQATAEKVQMLLVSGRKLEALQCALEGHLWGLAIVVATLLGDQFYGETLKKMALHQLVAGTPLRTLCLLLAGQPGEVFSNSSAISLQSGQFQLSEIRLNCMLDDWEENLAILIANRTKGDELVITHLGDCLWREQFKVMAAHICYLVAETNIEPYSESARLCLIGADHLKYSRTYATPEAIQRTELYEYAKVLGNSQFVLLPFQPYKVIYAFMLAEVGKLADSLKYCQSIMKTLRTGRSLEVDTCRLMITSLEERIKIHQQSGYNTNLAPTKFVGRLLNFFDNTAHRVVGGLPPPIPSASHSVGQRNELDHHPRVPRVSTSQSTMAMSSLMANATVEGTSRKSRHNRSVSEPDIGRTPRKVESPEKSSSTSPHDNSLMSRSRFGRFGSQIFQKTVGLVLRSRADRQAKLGDINKFYYDEKLKRWVEEGVEALVEEVTLAPPPTTASFMNEVHNHDKYKEPMINMKHTNGSLELKSLNSVDKIITTPTISPASNNFSASGRTSVRARYVDTFFKGGGTQASMLQSPAPLLPYVKPSINNAKFFIPTPVAVGQETDSNQSSPEIVITNEDTPMSSGRNSISSSQMFTPSAIMYRHPSMERMSNRELGMIIDENDSLPPQSRRTLSWSGGSWDYTNNSSMSDTRSLGEVLGFPTSTYLHENVTAPFSSKCTTVAEELQDADL